MNEAIPGPPLVCDCGHNATVHWPGYGCRKCDCNTYRRPKPPWFDKWQWTDPDQACTCGHLLHQHPADRFRSCARCLWCDDFREATR